MQSFSAGVAAVRLLISLSETGPTMPSATRYREPGHAGFALGRDDSLRETVGIAAPPLVTPASEPGSIHHPGWVSDCIMLLAAHAKWASARAGFDMVPGSRAAPLAGMTV